MHPGSERFTKVAVHGTKSSSVPAAIPNPRKRRRQKFCETLARQTLQCLVGTQTIRRCYYNASIFPPLKESPKKRQRLSQNHNHNNRDTEQVSYIKKIA